MIPHLTRIPGEFRTNLVVSNTADTIAPYHLIGHDDQGSQLFIFSSDLPTGQSLNIPIPSLFAPETAYLRIIADDSLKFGVSYRADRSDALPAFVPDARVHARRWRIYYSDADLGYDGFAIVNLGSELTNVRVDYYDNFDFLAESEDVIIDLAPGAKALHIIRPYQNFGEGYIDVVTDTPTALTALRGETSGRFLWSNPALPLD